MSSSQRSEALQWEAEFRFSLSKENYVCEIHVGPFPNQGELIKWRNNFIAALVGYSKGKKGVIWFLRSERVEEFIATQTKPLALQRPSRAARNFLARVLRTLIWQVNTGSS